MGNNAPCRGCSERYPGCHDHCSNYQEWNSANRAAKEARRKEIYTDHTLEGLMWNRRSHTPDGRFMKPKSNSIKRT